MDATAIAILKARPVLVTGAAGFIGFHLARALLEAGCAVVGYDNLNAYYDVALKRARLALLKRHERFTFVQADIVDAARLREVFAEHRPIHVAHLAAQAGVRHSLKAPQDYVASNLVGFAQVIEACREWSVGHLVYASSSSVYGANAREPASASHGADHPLSLYAATKRSNELVAHCYSSLYGLPTTGLRFFTVYGPWGRPDMAMSLFTDAILEGRPIKLFNDGAMGRDFTYVDDVVESVARVLAQPAAPDPAWSAAAPDPATSAAPWRIYNVGASAPTPLLDMLAALEQALGRAARRERLPMQPGDVVRTWADATPLERAIGYRPTTSLAEGVARYVAWRRAYERALTTPETNA